MYGNLFKKFSSIPRKNALFQAGCKLRRFFAGVSAYAYEVLHLWGAQGHQETGDSTTLQPAAMGLCRGGAEGLHFVEPGRGAAKSL